MTVDQDKPKFKLTPAAFALALVLECLSTPSSLSKEATAHEQTTSDKKTAQTKLKLEFNSSEPLGLLRFINGICRQPDEGQSFYTYFIAHHKPNKSDKQLMWRYVRFRRSKGEFTTPSGRSLNLAGQLAATACNTKGFEGFFREARQCCTENQYETLELVMNHFRPIYEQLIWKPFSPQLRKDLAWLKDNEQTIAGPLETVAKLYQSTAGRDRALKAMLVPVPTEVEKTESGFMYKTSANSENVDVAIVYSIGIVPPADIAAFNDSRVNNNRSLPDIDVLVHEFAHTLWAFRNPEFKAALIKYFEKHGTQFNYDLLNESQAAAIQAWFYKQVSGQDKGGKWYDNNYVDEYARALLPVLKEYTSQKGSQLRADDYAAKAIKAFNKTFPNYQDDPQVILWRSQIVQSPLSSEDLADELNDKLFEFSSGEHKVVLVKGSTWPEKFKNFSKNQQMTTVFLTSPEQIHALEKYFKLSTAVRQELDMLAAGSKSSGSASVKAIRDGDRWLLFSVAHRQALQKQGLLNYARGSHGNSEKPDRWP